jgi:maleate isomerase
MTDRLGSREKFGVLGPSTSTIVQPDFDDLRRHGVTNHCSRIFTPNTHAVSNETFMAGVQTIGGNTPEAVRSVMTCAPVYLVTGMSAVTFFGGVAGADRFETDIRRESGLCVSIGSHAVTAAMRALGDISRIAFLAPYFPAANAEVRRYFQEEGFTVARDTCLQCPSWTAIAEVPDDILRATLVAMNGPGDVDAIIQVGTNLSMISLASAAELVCSKPVISINTATYWHALRANGIKDQKPGFGRLLAES